LLGLDTVAREPQTAHPVCDLVGTTSIFSKPSIIYATAAVAGVFPAVSFPKAILPRRCCSRLRPSRAFFARPVGSALFGLLSIASDARQPLVTALADHGHLDGVHRPVCRPTHPSVCCGGNFCLSADWVSGVDWGGEWGGALLLATENSPPGKQAWYGASPQLGARSDFLCSTACSCLMTNNRTGAVVRWGWRVPFLASASSGVGGAVCYDCNSSETPAFQRSLAAGLARARCPSWFCYRNTLASSVGVLGTLGATTTFVVFLPDDGIRPGVGQPSRSIRPQHFLILQMVSGGVLRFDHNHSPTSLPIASASANSAKK